MMHAFCQDVRVYCRAYTNPSLSQILVRAKHCHISIHQNLLFPLNSSLHYSTLEAKELEAFDGKKAT